MMEKKKYERPLLRIEDFETEDVITRSGIGRLSLDEEDEAAAFGFKEWWGIE